MLGLSNCSFGSASHDDEQDGDASKGVFLCCGKMTAFYKCSRGSASQDDQTMETSAMVIFVIFDSQHRPLIEEPHITRWAMKRAALPRGEPTVKGKWRFLLVLGVDAVASGQAGCGFSAPKKATRRYSVGRFLLHVMVPLNYRDLALDLKLIRTQRPLPLLLLYKQPIRDGTGHKLCNADHLASALWQPVLLRLRIDLSSPA
ncbi:hypothetical protein HU200_028952 [Digitaria exilis]|uniref:Uncharacterized protein n=1 Tax=Digitaria exilis TaxID=1010633 RepID=A0A835BRE4_9POAL|nr:hypothetical protein HU200_028952 [Digitaria exilis]